MSKCDICGMDHPKGVGCDEDLYEPEDDYELFEGDVDECIYSDADDHILLSGDIDG